MSVVSCVAAECLAVRARLTRSRLGLWLALLVLSGLLLAARQPAVDAGGAAARLGLLAGVLAVSLAAGSAADRAALRAALAHPASAAALAGGRQAALTLAGAATVTVGIGTLGMAGRVPVGDIAPAIVGGAGATAAAVGAAHALAWLGGQTVTGVLFGYLVFVSGLPPEVWGVLVPGGAIRAIGTVALETLPGLWRYRMLASGDPGAWVHALAWALAGAAVVTWRLDRGRR